MVDFLDGIIDRYALASAEFERRLVLVRQWDAPTPCTEWDVRQLVNHMARGNLNYVRLTEGVSGAEFLRLRDADALGDDPVGSYARSVRECVTAFSQPGALQRIVDYPLGKVTGGQALAVRTTDTVIHTWDLARALGVDDELQADLVAWIDEHLDEIYDGLPVKPVEGAAKHRFFAASAGGIADDATKQERLLHWMGRQVR